MQKIHTHTYRHRVNTRINNRTVCPDLDYQDYANDYDERFDTPMCKEEDLVITELFLSIMDNMTGKKITDLCCGTALLLDLCGQYITDYTGIDISQEMILRARLKHPNREFITDDASRAMRKMETKQDVVVVLFGLPYIGTNAIDDIYNLLVDDGSGFAFFVYYKWPFMNPASCYAENKEHYLTNVLPRVVNCVAKLESCFTTVYNKPLTSSGSYSAALFKKAL